MVAFSRFKAFNGPKNIYFVDPDTGQKLVASDKEQLIKHIVAYRNQNNLPPIEELDMVLENFWCVQEENKYNCVTIEDTPLGILGYIKGGIVLFKNVMFKDFAPQEVAEERAKQCVMCPFNNFPDHAGFLEWTKKAAVDSVGERKVAVQEQLGECRACGCPLRAKVHYKGTLSFNDQERANMESVSCWQLKLEKKD